MHKWSQHKNARLTPLVRQEMVNRITNGEISKVSAGNIYGIHRSAVRKWVREVDETGNWLCLDKDSCPEKFRTQRGLKRLDEVQKRVNKSMTDNGREYRGKLERGHGFETVLDKENIKHVYTKIKTPKTNGKAERIIRTIMAWHRMIQFKSQDERSYRLTDFVEWYNSRKGHSFPKGETPLEFLVKHLKVCEKCTQRWQS